MSDRPLELTFTVIDVAPEPYSVSPVLTARVAVGASTDDPVYAIALRCQVRIEPLRRSYSAMKAAVQLGCSGFSPASSIARHFSSVRRSSIGQVNS